jgi:hypothetical protein
MMPDNRFPFRCPKWFGRLLAAAISLTVTGYLWSQSLEAGASFGILLEKSPVGARLVPVTESGIALDFPAPIGSIVLGLSGSTGSFLGTVLGVDCDATWRPPAMGGWEPGMGVSFSLDWGDTVFSSSTPAAAPPLPQAFAGLRIEPLRFRAGGWIVSWLDTDAQFGFFSFGSNFHLSTRLMAISWSPTPDRDAAEPPAALCIGVSESAGLGIVGNYMLLELNAAAPRLDLRWGAFELGMTWQSISSIGGFSFQGWRIAGELLFSPMLGAWEPGLGAGYSYSAVGPAAYFPDPDLAGAYTVVAPLRFGIPLGRSSSPILSTIH